MNGRLKKFGLEIECLLGTSKGVFLHKCVETGIVIADLGYTHEVMNNWKIVTDGSLSRNSSDQTPIELVSPPIKSRKEVKILKKICEILADCGTKVNKSCGLHVHIDFYDNHVTLKELVYLLKMYAQYENAIDSFMPASRRMNNNSMCRSIKQISTTLKTYAPPKTGKDLQKLIPGRYFKVNCMAYTKYGTIEFRHHSGSIEYDKIINWVKVIQAMVKKAQDVAADNGNFNLDASLESFLNEIEAYIDSKVVNYILKRARHFKKTKTSQEV